MVRLAGVFKIQRVSANPNIIITKPAITLVMVDIKPGVTELITTNIINSIVRYMCFLKTEKYLLAIIFLIRQNTRQKNFTAK